jgi:hypothetical protein
VDLEDKAKAARRAKGIGVSALCLSWVLNDGLLSLTKIALVSLSGSGRPPGGPRLFPGDGWWVSLIIAVFVGFVSYSAAEDDLTPNSFRSEGGVNWWGSFWRPILVGVAVYHVAWVFQYFFGWNF